MTVDRTNRMSRVESSCEEAGKAMPRLGRDVLIIGGYGEVGNSIAAHLQASDRDIRIAIAGRNPAKARAAARRWGQHAKGLALDAEDEGAFMRASENASLVILNTEAANATVARACIRKGVPMISVAASVSVLQSIDALHDSAKASGVTLVRDVGLAPGLIQMLAARTAGHLPAPELVEVFVELGILGHHGREATAWILARIAEAQGPLRVTGPAGALRAIAIDFVDRPKMAAKLRSGKVASYFIPVPQWIAIWLLRAAPILRKRPDMVRRTSALFASVWSFFHLPNDQFRLSARVTSFSTHSTISLRGCGQSKVTGVLAAETGLAILRDGAPGGVVGMDDVLVFGSLRKHFDDLGLVVEETVQHERQAHSSARDLHHNQRAELSAHATVTP